MLSGSLGGVVVLVGPAVAVPVSVPVGALVVVSVPVPVELSVSSSVRYEIEGKPVSVSISQVYHTISPFCQHHRVLTAWRRQVQLGDLCAIGPNGTSSRTCF